jgi:hypothetical protein
MTLAGVAAAQGPDSAGVPCVACQAFSVAPDQVAALPDRLEGVRMLVRIAPETTATAWTAAVTELRRRGGRAGVHVTGIPSDGDRVLSDPGDELVIDVPAGEDPDRLAFDLKRALSRARGERPGARLIVAADAETRDALDARGIRTYADEFLPPIGLIQNPADLLLARPAASTSSQVWRLPQATRPGRSWPPPRPCRRGFPPGSFPLRSAGSPVAKTGLLPLLNPQTLDLVAVSRRVRLPPSSRRTCRARPSSGWRSATSRCSGCGSGTGERFATGVDVAAARTLTVEEIIARHQAAAARQAAGIRSEIATDRSRSPSRRRDSSLRSPSPPRRRSTPLKSGPISASVRSA